MRDRAQRRMKIVIPLSTSPCLRVPASSFKLEVKCDHSQRKDRPLAKVVAGVLWGLNKGDRYPLFITFTYLLGCTDPEFMVVQSSDQIKSQSKSFPAISITVSENLKNF